MQKINLKKTTKEQMLNMLETAWQANAGANEEIAALSKRIEEQNDALAKCVAEKNELRRERVNVETMTNQRNAAIAESKDLRTKLDYTKAALGRANAEVSRVTVGCRQVEEERDYMHQQWSNAEQRANYAEAHPWRNLWAWVKRKLGWVE